MPTTTWSVARVDILRPMGVVEAATTTNITTDDKVISTNLQDDYGVDDTFNGWYVMLLNDSDGSTSSNNGIVRRVEDYAGSSGQLTIAGANLSAEDETTDLILSRFNPDHVKSWYNRVRQNLFPEMAIIRDHQLLVTGQQQRRFLLPTTLRGKPTVVSVGEWPSAAAVVENEVTDPGFENWTSATDPASWTVSGTSATVNQEEQTTGPRNYNVFRDDNAARVLGATSGATTLLQTVTPSVSTQAVEANFGIAVYATFTSPAITARIASTDGTAHGGTGWEILNVAANVAEATTVSVGVAVASSGAAATSHYVDEAILIMGQSEGIVPSWEELLRWDWIPNVAGGSNNGYLELPYNLPEHYVVRVLGRDLLSSVSADTDTIEIDGELLEPMYDAVRAELAQEAASVSVMDTKERDFWFGQAAFYRDRSRSALIRRHISLPNPRIQVPDWGHGQFKRSIAR